MTGRSLAQLLALGAIWGAAHTLTRYSVAVFGPIALVEIRIGLAALLLAAVAWWTRRSLYPRRALGPIAVLGTINTALPFFLHTYAAQSLDASVLSVLNATAPVFGALIGAVWLRQPLTLRMSVGLLIGMAGVAVLLSGHLAWRGVSSPVPVLAALGTALAYGVASNYARRYAADLDHFHLAHGSLWIAFLLIAPTLPFASAAAPITSSALAAAVTLGVLCTGVAYLLYFKLIREVGPTSALTVAYLIPVFGVLWGVLFLGEPVTPALLIGAAMVIIGTAATTGFTVRVSRLVYSRHR